MGGNANARVAQERREGWEEWWREGEVCSLVTCGVLFGARRRARARRRCVSRRVSAKAKARRLTALPTSAINTLERVLRHQGRSASPQRQRKSSRWQQRAHVRAVLRRFDNTSLSGYQPLVVIPLVSTRMSAAAPGKTKRIVTTATHNGSIAVAGAQVSSTPSVSRVLFLSHTSNCGGRGRGGARSAAQRDDRRVSAWAKALEREVCSPAPWRCDPRACRRGRRRAEACSSMLY